MGSLPQSQDDLTKTTAEGIMAGPKRTRQSRLLADIPVYNWTGERASMT